MANKLITKYLLINLSVFILMFTSMFLLAKDPTRPLLYNQPSATTKKVKAIKSKQPLTAIFTRSQQRFAIIDGKHYKTGDYYHGDRIIKIDPDKVFLSASSGRYQLILIPKIKK